MIHALIPSYVTNSTPNIYFRSKLHSFDTIKYNICSVYAPVAVDIDNKFGFPGRFTKCDKCDHWYQPTVKIINLATYLFGVLDK